MFCRVDLLKNFVRFTGKHLCRSLFFNKVVKKKVWCLSVSCELSKFCKNTFYTEDDWNMENT